MKILKSLAVTKDFNEQKELKKKNINYCNFNENNCRHDISACSYVVIN